MRESKLRNINIDNDQEIHATEKEKLFIQEYRIHGNATACVLKFFTERQWTNQQARTKGWLLVKKFNLKGRNKILTAKKHGISDLVRYVEDKYKHGEIDEEELFSEMRNLAYHSTSDQTRFNALSRLKEWFTEARSEIEASKLSSIEIEQLMIDAMSNLPNNKYLGVLRGIREKRQKLIKERSIIYDPDTERHKELEIIMKHGGNKCHIDQVT